MKIYCIKTWSIIILLVLVMSSSAIKVQANSGDENQPVLETIYYIDYENGDNNNDGTTPQTAWKHAPGDINATGNPLAHVPGPGDTFLFKGGVVKAVWNTKDKLS